jgi:hypothetical protein
VIDQQQALSRKAKVRERFHDRVMSILLTAIWLTGAWFVRQSDTDIPLSMFAIATAFFITLLPAMKELIKTLDKWLRAELGLSDSHDDGSGDIDSQRRD